jgi:hypothetical protein
MPRLTRLPLAAAFLFAACSSNEQATVDSAASAAPAVNTVNVVAADFTFTAPDTIPAGPTRFQITNTGMDFHHLIAVHIDSGHTVGELLQAMQTSEIPPSWAHMMGGPIAPSPNGAATATIVDLPAGNYALICVVPAAADGMPHVAKGMVKEMVVTPATGTPAAAAVPSTVTMTLNDYSFTTSAPLTAGKHSIRVVNAAQQPHEVVFVRLAPGKTAQDIAAFAMKPQGPPPGEVVGGAGTTENIVELDLTPGDYALLCFVPDAKDKKPHLEHGMIQQITIN